MKSVLAIDDNLTVLKQISAQLADKYDVFLAKSGALGLKMCRNKKPDIILLDVEMPEMNGFQTIAWLKDDQKLNRIPVIFLTGNKDAETEVKCLESGAVDFVTKPADTDILQHRIKLHLEFYSYQFQLEHKIREMQDNLSIFFAEMVECKDSTIADHIIRTGALAELLASELLADGEFTDELNSDSIALLKRAAPLHDVGKIGVSDLFLRKTSHLLPEEYLEVQKHTVIGAQMLGQVYERTPSEEYLKLAMTIAEGHHERFDGTGYPNGLKGDDIPLACRIVSLVNAYNVLVIDRVYRKKVSHEAACQIILESNSRQFDPRIMNVFSRIKDDFDAICSEPYGLLSGSKRGVYDAANFGS